MKCALTVAGFDPIGGAGIQADLKVFKKYGVHGLSVLTAITAQNTSNVDYIEAISINFFKRQLNTLLNDIKPDSIKTGMLFSSDLIKSLKDVILSYNLKNLVIDPVIVSSSGKKLIEDRAIDILREELFPIAKVITPNIYEATLFTGLNIYSKSDLYKASIIFKDMGPEIIIITGGHFKESEDIKSEKAIDLFFDGNKYHEIDSVRYPGEYHGTGCTFSAAITANLALGHPPLESVKYAKDLMQSAIKDAYYPGKGMAILNV